MKDFFIKRYYRYILILTVIFTVALIFAGRITVEERGRKIFTGEKYETVMLQNTESGTKISLGEKEFTVKESIFLKPNELRKIISYTPFNTFFYAFQNIKTS